MKVLPRRCVGLLLMLNSAVLMAAELPSYYPSSFDKIGTVDVLPTATSPAVVISDSTLNVSRDVHVHTLSARTATLSVLKIGQLIAVSIVGAGPGSKGRVTEIWTLPSDFKRR